MSISILKKCGKNKGSRKRLESSDQSQIKQPIPSIFGSAHCGSINHAFWLQPHCTTHKSYVTHTQPSQGFSSVGSIFEINILALDGVSDVVCQVLIGHPELDLPCSESMTCTTVIGWLTRPMDPRPLGTMQLGQPPTGCR